jgi:hypoxanthine phosphoribosyltransferase
MTEYLFIDYKTWGDIMDGLVSQLKKLKKMSGIYDFTHVYAPPRGGLPIAVHLSHHLNIQMIANLFEYFEEEFYANNVLVIDDVIDTGKTFTEIKSMLDCVIDDHPTFQYKLASIHYKPRAIIKPEIYLQEVPNNTWIVYPWEHLDNRKYDEIDFKLRRKRELAIETGKPVVTATQIPEQDKLIWRSFLGEHE